MFIAKTLLTLAALSLGVPVAMAQDAATDRYTLEKSESGFVRLDRQTGAVTLCTEADGTLTCRMAADERAAYDADLARLEKRIEALEKRVAEGTAAKSGELPSDAEIDRSIGIMERFMRTFFGLVQEFQGQEQDGSGDPVPDRT
ncbi:hypothetical protein [Rhizobium sp. AAP116]|uniref:hypothetical protein n=1 Tax=Rhizobium sp. AAP116 TaxID=1523429 RepID=UPI0006B87FDF|nr:hypothetical protein [Rhizobium sp. AAP116]KPF59335.1 hypothetical protein IP85_07525 [Rhizobium sp. AAP116]MDM7979382.1 hypothetical protein [Rhizobium sp.]MDM8015949.1 hypothetical protein [Rhizobium sp.]